MTDEIRKGVTAVMSQIILGTGKYALKPYYVDKFYVNLYSVEELCYLLVEKAELLDQDMLQRELVQWLDEQCGLNDLAHTLYSLLNQNGSAVAFVGTILEYVNLYPEEVIVQTEQVVKSNEGLNPYERKKAKADYMLQNKKYFMALKQYYSLIEQVPESDKTLRSAILHNMGVTCAGMFMYEQAADWFMQAYGQDRNAESLEMYLASQRMHYEDKEYITFIADHPEYHDASLRVERRMNQASGQFEGTDENRMLFTLQVFKEEGSGTGGSDVQYYQEIDKLTIGLKEKYREYVS
ncbi:MAG: hypothetical protein K2L82_16030 [Lachnospiraceae bacterium]|nr:hypothetical protein [Lachnospiraceae bacterium]